MMHTRPGWNQAAEDAWLTPPDVWHEPRRGQRELTVKELLKGYSSMKEQAFTIQDLTKVKRPEWLQLRRSGIGGSDAAALMLPAELYKWKRPADVYRSKVDQLPDERKLVCEMGNALEPVIAEQFAIDNGKKVYNYRKMLRSVRYPWMLADIDRKISGENAGLECKYQTWFGSRQAKRDPETGETLRNEEGKVIWESKYENDNFPINFYFQCLHYLIVTGWDRWYLSCCVDGEMHYRIIERDDPQTQQFMNELIEKEQIFWNEVVVPRNEKELETWT